MNPQRLLQHFDTISEAPDAVAKLRRFILDLAVRGMLTVQDRDDVPASTLLTPQKGTDATSSAPAPVKRPIPNIDVEQREHPFVLPAQWAFVRLGTVLGMINGRAFKPSDWLESGLPIIRIQNLNNPNAPFNHCDPQTVDERHLVRDGEFLISWSGTPGTSFGAFIWKRGLAALNQHIFRCVQVGRAYDPEFLQLAINSQLSVLISQAQGGVGLQHVTKGTLQALPLPLPPQEEQHRIVAKVDELMALCDQLQAARGAREQRRERLAAASLYRLTANDTDDSDTTTDPAARRVEHARFHLQHLPRLTRRAEDVKQLRKTILNLAVRGELVLQDPKDAPASKLLEQIAAIKNTPRRVTVKTDGEAAPYPVPASWQWAALDELITSGPQNGISPRPTKRADAPLAITLTATTTGVFNAAHFKRVEANIPDDSGFWLRKGDLLFQRGNTREYVGMAAYYEGPSSTFLFPDLIIRVRVSSLLSLRFVHLAAISPPARIYLSANATGAQSTMPKINGSLAIRVEWSHLAV